ncbi:MAG: BrnT family toxin [Bosea sp. (in: a-proteobacteria)]|uniref:BrnT family toxin n=1 Tax=Bosea sp. (in: a-proteobacteria) TaxID=1871050 RepID=UPI002734C3E4|nr:BrnT family toxin [Bosea sp. (in: a-proteobacteria)]MDP3258586.1 BrnT family toxin [Bosea sp. (in: a-proteobacteria)]MDP3319770.1 BrnT family toxin [Bosea sp. (in: a-proteobacteria)]
MGFQWDEAKSKANEAKHGLSFLQAAQMFRGFVVLTVDRRRDYGEVRQWALGLYDGEILCVVLTERGGDIRIISACKAGQRERQRYEQARKARAL